jgi:fructose/tagatose bisphosphate aldolase
MSLISLRQLLDHAAENECGVPTFNVNNFEQIQAIMKAAAQCQAPVIPQATAGARKYAGEPSVPQEWLAVIRHYGGEIEETYGVPVEEIVRGIRSGVRKVNIDTDIRLVMTGAMRCALAEQRTEFDPCKAQVAARNAARNLCRERFAAFGCAGQAQRIKPLPLERMVARHR